MHWKQPRGQWTLGNCLPLQGLVHLHVLQSVLSLPQDISACPDAQLFMRRQLAWNSTSSTWTEEVAISLKLIDPTSVTTGTTKDCLPNPSVSRVNVVFFVFSDYHGVLHIFLTCRLSGQHGSLVWYLENWRFGSYILVRLRINHHKKKPLFCLL